jgi:hypothetical protein
VGANAEVPLIYCFERIHLLDVVRIEVLELQPIREQHPANESAGGDGEAALVEGHERHHVSRRRVRHGRVSGNDLLDGISEGRKLARFDVTEELLVGDVGDCQVRHRSGEALGELEACHTLKFPISGCE